jgi:hypothetical protein
MILITDLDHTLAAASWRDHYKGQWDIYHQMAKDDKPIWPMINLVTSLSNQNFNIVCITTRPAKWRKLTMDWLLRHQVGINYLLMRPDDDYRPSPELKVELAKPYWREHANSIVAIDDREDVLAAYAEVGIKALLRML